MVCVSDGRVGVGKIGEQKKLDIGFTIFSLVP